MQLPLPPVTPQIEIGQDFLSPWFGPHVDLDRTDQGAATSSAAAGIATLICIETEGWARPAAAAMLTATAFYIAVNGYCPNSLGTYTKFGGYPMGCVC
jgi:hypothetical protein